MTGTVTIVESPAQFTASRPKSTASRPCRISLARGVSPSERSWATFS